MSFLIRCHIFNQLISAIAAFLTILTAGFWMTWIAVALPKLRTGEIKIPMTKDELTWMIVLFDIGSLITPIPSGYLMDRLGRLFCLRLCSIFSISTTVLTMYATSLYHLWAARFFAGMSKGIGFTVASVYVAEIAGQKIKGALNGMFITLMGSGALTAAGIGSIISLQTLNWISLIFPTVQFFLLLIATESPYYFFIRNDGKSAARVLRQVRNASKTTCTDKELEAIRRCVEDDMKRPKNLTSLLAEKGDRKALVIVLAGALLQRFSGICIMTTYATSTVPSDEFWNVKVTHVIFVTVPMVFSLLSLSLVDWCGRKPLLIISSIGTAFTTGLSAVFYYYHQLTNVDVSGYIFVPHVCWLAFGMSYIFGVAPIPHTLQGEMLPTRLKSQASAAFAMTQAISNFTIHKIYNIVDHQIGVYFMYLLSCFSSVVIVLFAAFFVIETKGKSLPEIQDELNHRTGAVTKNENMIDGTISSVTVGSQLPCTTCLDIRLSYITKDNQQDVSH